MSGIQVSDSLVTWKRIVFGIAQKWTYIFSYRHAIKEIISYPVFLKKVFTSSHLCILKHPFENPNNPPFCFLNGWQEDVEFPTP